MNMTLLGASGVLAHGSWGSWWMIPTFFVYGALHGGVSDSRWHECGHRTAFKTAWMNDAVYGLASFMVWREAVSRRGVTFAITARFRRSSST